MGKATNLPIRLLADPSMRGKSNHKETIDVCKQAIKFKGFT